MGNQLSLASPFSATYAIDAYVAELRTVKFEKNLGNARFLKTVRGTIEKEGSVIVKVFVKPTPDIDLKAYSDEILSECACERH